MYAETLGFAKPTEASGKIPGDLSVTHSQLEMELQFQWLVSSPCRLVLGEIPCRPWHLLGDKAIADKAKHCTLKWGWDEFIQSHQSAASKLIPLCYSGTQRGEISISSATHHSKMDISNRSDDSHSKFLFLPIDNKENKA